MPPGTMLSPGTEVWGCLGAGVSTGLLLWCIQMQMLPGLQRSQGRRAERAWIRNHPRDASGTEPEQHCPLG